MATRLYSVGKNKNEKGVVQAAGIAVVTSEIEVTIDLAVVTTKGDAMRGLMDIYRFLKANNWPPA